MNSDRVSPTRERALGMVLIAITAALALAIVALAIYEVVR
jgi:hypothetical protein